MSRWVRWATSVTDPSSTGHIYGCHFCSPRSLKVLAIIGPICRSSQCLSLVSWAPQISVAVNTPERSLPPVSTNSNHCHQFLTFNYQTVVKGEAFTIKLIFFQYISFNYHTADITTTTKYSPTFSSSLQSQCNDALSRIHTLSHFVAVRLQVNVTPS